MAKYTTLQRGSSGTDVEKLQQKLIDEGYLQIDAPTGFFGSKTQAAVENYQKSNGLTVDGIAGEQTLGNIYGGATTGQQTGQTGQIGTQTPSAVIPTYTESDGVKQAWQLLEQHQSTKPGSYVSQWGDQLNTAQDAWMNRDPFSYDINGDALYQQLADRFAQQAKMAMMDTMGQAATLTGGYGNSYAQQVGQQAYDQKMQGLNDMVPELYQMAMSQYQLEGDAMKEKYAMLMDREQQDYGRWQADQEAWMNERDYLYGRYADQRDFDVQQYQQDYAMQQDNYDKLVNLITSTGYVPTQAELTAAGMSPQQAAAYAKYYQGQQGGNYEYSEVPVISDPVPSNPYGYSSEEIKALQRSARIPVTGEWNDTTANAYKAGYRPTTQNNSVGNTVQPNALLKSAEQKVTLHKKSAHGPIQQEMYGRDYEAYLDREIQKALDSGRLTAEEAQALYVAYLYS